MRALARIALVTAVGTALLIGRQSAAVIMLMEIRSPRQLPEGVTVRTELRDGGMLAFDFALDPEQVAHAGELYRGRVKPRAVLKVMAGTEELTSVAVQGTTEGRQTHYRFRLSPSAARASELQLGVSLYEKDGHPTVGGGVSMQIHLGGFEPARKPGKSAAKPPGG